MSFNKKTSDSNSSPVKIFQEFKVCYLVQKTNFHEIVSLKQVTGLSAYGF